MDSSELLQLLEWLRGKRDEAQSDASYYMDHNNLNMFQAMEYKAVSFQQVISYLVNKHSGPVGSPEGRPKA